MDLLYALDDRFQVGSAELAAVAPVARLFGADTIWLPGDAAFDRFRTPRPELTAELFAGWQQRSRHPRAVRRPGRQFPAGADGRRAVAVRSVDRNGHRSDRPRSCRRSGADRPGERHCRPAVGQRRRCRRRRGRRADRRRRGDPLQRLVARRTNSLRHSRRQTSSWSPTATGAVLTTGGAPRTSPATPNRQRAGRLVWEDSGDARLDVFPDAESTAYTVSVQDGPVAATATSYGERFSYQPEARPAMAIDGDPNTSWTVLDPAGQYIEITTDSRRRPHHRAATERPARCPAISRP